MIPVFDFRPGYERHRAEFDAAIARVLASGQLILGPEVRAFEGEFADHVGVALGVGVASGTDALVLALRALGISAETVRGHLKKIYTQLNVGSRVELADCLRSLGIARDP